MTDLAWERRGHGPALVLLHPLGADRRMWDPVLERLAAVRTVVAVDMPGFGASPPLRATPTPEALARAIVRGLAGVVDAPFHVAGNSLGGWVALEVARAGNARSVTAIAPAGLWARALGPRPSAARRAARLAAPLARVLVQSTRARGLALAGTVAHPERVPPAAAAHLVRAYASAPGFDDVNAAMRSGRFAHLGDLRVPVTLAWPDRDRLVGRPRALPSSVRSVTLRGCGHLPTWDDPAQVAEVLLAGSIAG
ncbi:MAG: alpha/beta fold hydrolase [Anaeromyxobacteraceae bacterium]